MSASSIEIAASAAAFTASTSSRCAPRQRADAEIDRWARLGVARLASSRRVLT